MSTVPTTTDVQALAAAVRDGELTPEQRECLVTLLHGHRCVGGSRARAGWWGDASSSCSGASPEVWFRWVSLPP
jgi:hypothetical protein